MPRYQVPPNRLLLAFAADEIGADPRETAARLRAEIADALGEDP